ncbi:MAG: sugar ABC transporter permease [Clostridia bacterium]|nr:sugar ABC transporter permease [Clostridia bacterium]
MQKQRTMKKEYVQKLIFYVSIIGLPLIQFMIFYLFVNFNSLLLSFKNYEMIGGELTQSFAGFTHLLDAYKLLFTEPLFAYCLKNSVVFYLLNVISGTVFSLSFSYYIYKKRNYSNFFKAMLYLPAIVSGMVLSVVFKYFFNLGIPAIVKMVTGTNILGWTDNFIVEYYMVVIYNFIISLGSNMLIYTGTMASISESSIEAAQLDGANKYQEFWYIVIPSIFRTLSLFLVTNLLTIFNGQHNIFNFFGQKASEKLYTFGYYLYIQVLGANGNLVEFPPIAALGLALTSFAIPIMFTVRWLFNKYGPSEE